MPAEEQPHSRCLPQDVKRQVPAVHTTLCNRNTTSTSHGISHLSQSLNPTHQFTRLQHSPVYCCPPSNIPEVNCINHSITVHAHNGENADFQATVTE